MVIVLLELACVAAVVAGVALIHVPAALILAGLVGVVACERELTRRAMNPGVRGGGEQP